MGAAGVQAAYPLWQSDDADGIISVEAENFDENTPQGGDAWELVGPTDGFTGVAGMQALPNDGSNRNDNYLTMAPRLDYEAFFVKTGTHYVWVRAWGGGGADDSFHVGLDGQAIDTCDRMDGINGNYTWTSSTMDTDPSLFEVTSLGRHTLNIWMREDGAIIDKLVVTSNPAYTPTGDGPSESVRAPAVKAYAPDPADGATGVELGLLKWSSGDTALLHDVYVGASAELTEADRAAARQPAALAMHFVAPLEPGTTYYWRVDQIEPDGTVHTGDVWSFSTLPATAWGQSPPDGAIGVAAEATLEWQRGINAQSHDVYLGTSAADVAGAAEGTVQAMGQAATSLAVGPLEPGTTYYWRVDEIVVGGSKTTGPVWSFTTIPELAVSDPDLIGWWKLDEGASTAVDWSGYGNHGTLAGAAEWAEGYGGGAISLDGVSGYIECPNDPSLDITSAITIAAWINRPEGGPSDDRGIVSRGGGWEDPGYTLWHNDGSNVRAELQGPNDKQALSTMHPPFGEWGHIAFTWDDETDVVMLYVNGELRTTGGFAGPIGASTAALRIGDYGGQNRHFFGLIDDVRLYQRALTADEISETMRADLARAWKANPANAATTDAWKALPLTWAPGEGAVQHDVYLTADPNAIDDANTATTDVYRGRLAGTQYTPDPELEWGQDYLWRVDEVDSQGTVSAGDVWSFSLTDYISIDDFESYTNTVGWRVFEVWIDGVGFTQPEPGNPGNGTGAAVGHDVWTPGGPHYQGSIIETANVHSGGQAMPMYFTGLSETTRTFVPAQNWARDGITTLVLFVAEDPANTGGDLYIKINDQERPLVDEGTYPPGFDPGYVQYNIDLTTMNVFNVRTLTIGVRGAAAEGVIFVDDIRLYREPPVPLVLTLQGQIIEAESGTITAPFEVLSNIPGASGGQYVMVPNGTGGSGDGPAAPDDGWAVYTFNAPADGDYVIALRGLRQVANDGGDDSLWVRVPDAVLGHVPFLPPDWIRCGGVFPGDAQDVMVWDLVRDWIGTAETDVDPVIFTLTAGEHELQISRREDGTGLDAIAIFRAD
jgi:hypothetical protein